jgi:hypothetical protein
MFHVLPVKTHCQISTFCIQSGEIAQDVGAFLTKVLRRLQRSRTLRWLYFAVRPRLAKERSLARPLQPPGPAPRLGTMSPGAFEQRFARLQRLGRFDDMWSMLAEDAQLSWGSRQSFAEGMREQSRMVELLDAEVQDVDLVAEWTDTRASRTYTNVARLEVSYRVRQREREWTMRRQVHLVPALDGWRTLCYASFDADNQGRTKLSGAPEGG